MLDIAAKFTKPVIAYHGTSADNLRTILKKGLLPSAVGKWTASVLTNTSVNSRSHQTFGGVYFTKNLLTATNAAGWTGPNQSSKLIVIAQVQVRDALADEDNITIPTLPDYMLQSQVIAYRCKLTAYIDPEIARMRDRLLHNYAPDYPKRKDLKALQAIALEVLLCEYERRLAHEAKDNSKLPYRMSDIYKRYTGKSVLPKAARILSVPKAEARLRTALKMFMAKIKTKHIPPDDSKVWYNFRTLKPVGFSGATKILAVVEIPLDRKTLTVHYGKIPDVFYEEYKKVIGPLPPVVYSKTVDKAAAAKNSYEFYTFRGSRNVVLHQRKNGSIADYHLKKGDVYGVKYTNVQGPEYTAVILHDQPKNVFYVPNGSLKRVLQYSTKYKGAKVTPAPAKLITPAHLLQTRPAWLAAKPNSMGNRKTWQWFVLAKWANAHVNVNVTPRELYYAARFMVSGFDDAVPETERKKYLMALHRGRKAQLQLFSKYLTPADCITLALWIRTPNSKGRPAAIALIGKHDIKWKVRSGRYVSVRSKS